MTNTGALDHAPADVALQALIDAGLLTDGEADPTADPGSDVWPAWASAEPDVPDDAVWVVDAQGVPGTRDHVQGVAEMAHGVQVSVRSRLPNVGARKAWGLRTALAENVAGASRLAMRTVTLAARDGVPAASYVLVCFEGIGPVLPATPPESRRFIHTVNALMTLRRA